jgi:hypothetical protein
MVRFEKRVDAKGKIDGFELDQGLSCLLVHSKKKKSIINFYPLAEVLI